MPSGLWVLRISIWEESTPDYPVVVHEFVGKTQEEAEGYFHSHLKTDTFLRGCWEKGRWTQIPCRTYAEWLRT